MPTTTGATTLGSRERALLAVLVESEGRVLDRDQLRRLAGLQDLNPRRCDSLLVSLRKTLGPGALLNVRRRGWRLNADALAVALTLLSSLG